MNILIVSNLKGNMSEGPSYSVPSQVVSLSTIDNVLWYNVQYTTNEEWKKLSQYCDLTEYPRGLISCLPEPFCHPDVVLVEMFYRMAFTKIPYELFVKKIPYILIPRGELTRLAQNNSKKLKKILCNALFFHKYARKALAIQYLTEREKEDSNETWNKKCFVVPNGCCVQNLSRKKRNTNEIRFVSIGRIDIYHKGLDLFLKACAKIKECIKESNSRFHIYGPASEDQMKNLMELINDYSLDEFVKIHPAVFGEEKRDVLLEADVFFITSRFEGHPTALLEALSFGLPSLVSKGSNMKSEIEEFDAGWGVDNSVESIAQGIKTAILDQNAFDMKSTNAISLALKYEWNKLAMDTHTYLDKLIQGLEL